MVAAIFLSVGILRICNYKDIIITLFIAVEKASEIMNVKPTAMASGILIYRSINGRAKWGH